MSTSDDDTAATTSPLLNPRPHRRPAIPDTLSFISQVNSRRMLSEHSLRVRESAARIIEERRSTWAYSMPIVIIDLIWNALLVLTAVVVMVLGKNEVMDVPLRFWVVGHVVQCVSHMVCVWIEYRRRREARVARVSSLIASSLGVGSGFGSGLNLNVSSESSPIMYSSSSENLISNTGSNASVDAGFVEFVPDRRRDEDNTSGARHMESANIMFSFMWWIMGFYWVTSGGDQLAASAPKLYWLTTVYLAFDVCFVVICVLVACVVGIAVCCFLPCIIAVLYTVSDQEGASVADIERLAKYKFCRVVDKEKPSTSAAVQTSCGGVMTECNTDTPTTKNVSAEDAACPICLDDYENDDEIRELPCHHHLHCKCIDKWLLMNPTCPLCKGNILENCNQSSIEVASIL